MDTELWWLLAGISFAVVTGANDGGTIIATGLRAQTIRPWLALIGGLIGAGLAFGLSVGWQAVIVVLAVGVVAPVCAGLIGRLLARVMRWLPSNRHMASAVRWATLSGFGLQSLAYGANDAQKMLPS